jgi:hypothetical protein
MSDPQQPESADAYVVYDNADTPAPDLDAPLIEHRYERTVPKVTGAPYDLQAVIRERKARDAAAGAFDAGGHVEVVAPGWWCSPDDLPRAPKPIAKRLIEQGWEVRCCASIAYVTPTLFVSATDGHAKGDLRFEEHDDTSWSIQAVMRRGPKAVAAFWATWITKETPGQRPGTTFKDAITHDLVLGQEYVKKAGEFTDWLAIFAPETGT